VSALRHIFLCIIGVVLLYEWYLSMTQILVAVGMAVGTAYFILTRRAFRLFYYSILSMVIGSASVMVPVQPVSYAMWALGHLGVGMFIVSILFILIKLAKMAADAVPLAAREL
jgi:hypothetical protein